MDILLSKFKEVSFSVLPISLIVLILHFTLVPLEGYMLAKFVICAIMIIIGLGIFLWGADIGVGEMGSVMGKHVARTNNRIFVFLLGLVLGFMISIAEPDLLILANQVSAAMDGALSPAFIVGVVSIGVGVMIGIGFLRILLDKKLTHMFTITYIIIFLIFVFVSEEFQAIAFDASGATTGAMTTPFILALGLGVSKMKGSDNAEEDSFGLVGAASAGPILAIMIMSIILGLKNMGGTAPEFIPEVGVLGPILKTFPITIKESFIALFPICMLFILMNRFKFKLERRELTRILKGLVYTFIGLVLFLVGVNAGFMDIARVIGSSLAGMNNPIILPLFGFIIGTVVVLAEPAVHVLGHQVEDLTSGSIQKRIILITLSIGVAIAVSLSMIKIQYPGVKLWMFLVPGFIIAIIMSYRVPPIFVGIAFDSGGVASGPMTATFILALTQGAAASIPTADVLIDGFGVIAMVAMTPVVAIMTLGLIFKKRSKKEGIKVG